MTESSSRTRSARDALLVAAGALLLFAVLVLIPALLLIGSSGAGIGDLSR